MHEVAQFPHKCVHPLSLVLLLSPLLSCVALDFSIYETFVQCLSNHTNNPKTASSIVYTPQNSSYSTVLQAYIRNLRFNTSTAPKPAIIVTPRTESHVQAAVLCCKKTGLLLKIRSGGHDYDGVSYTADLPFLLLDMFNLRSISVESDSHTAWVQTGATLGELYYKVASTSNNTLAFPAGVCPTVGVGGHVSSGGYGNMLRKYGLAVDNLLDARIADVSGRILDRNAMGEDLFWAICGGGGSNFGVVLAYKIRLVSVPQTVTVFRVDKTLEENATDLLYKWQFIADKIDNDLFIRVRVTPVEKTISASFIALFLGDSNRLINIMNSDFPELGLKKLDCTEMSWIESVVFWADFDNGTSIDVLLSRDFPANHLKRKSDYVQTPIPKSGLDSISKKMIELGKTKLLLNPYGGRMSEIPAPATPFPHRAGNIYKIQYSLNWNETGSDADKKYLDQIRSLYSFMTPFVAKNPRAAFLNYRDVDIGINTFGKNSYNEGKVHGEKYFLNNFDRLVKVKTMVDPGNFFRGEQSIPVLALQDEEEAEIDRPWLLKSVFAEATMFDEAAEACLERHHSIQKASNFTAGEALP